MRHRTRSTGLAWPLRNAGSALSVALLTAVAGTSLSAQDTTQLSEPDSLIQDAPVDSAARARDVLRSLDSLYTSVLSMGDSVRRLDGEAAALFRVEAMPIVERIEDLKTEMVEELEALGTGTEPADSIRLVFQDFLRREFSIVSQTIGERTSSLDSLRQLRTSSSTEELSDLEEQLRLMNAQLDTTLEFTRQSLEDAEAVGIDTGEQWGLFDRHVLTRAAGLTGRLQLALAERSNFEDRIREARNADAEQVEIDDLSARLRVVQQRIAGLSEGLEATADLLDERDIETSSYRQLLIQATGEVTSDVLDPTVALGLFRDTSERVWEWARDTVPTLLVRLALLLGSIFLFRFGFKVFWWVFERTGGRKMTRLMNDLLERMLMPVATLAGLGFGLTILGVDPTALLTGVGVAGIIVGLALQDTLSNIASGVFILLYRPFDVDDVVTTAGITGKVKAMGLANTIIVTFDNRKLFVPNQKVWGEVIENKSAEATRRIDHVFPVSYEEDLERALSLVMQACVDYELVLDDPETIVYVSNFDDSALELTVRAWALSEDWWTVTTQLPRLVRLRFAEEGLEVPYPRQIDMAPKSGTVDAP